MFDKKIIKEGLKTLQNAGYIGPNIMEDFFDLQIDRALEYGSNMRNCTVEELKAENKNYNNVIISMVHSAINLMDKYGVTSVSQNGVMNIYENGNIYQNEDIKQFVPRLRSIR